MTTPPGDLSILDRRPAPGVPRPYHFPRFRRSRLDNGLTVVAVDVPGRPLLAAELVVEGGAASEAEELAGVTWLTGRAMSEGTRRRDAIAFVEATERLGAAISTACSWEALGASLTVPRRHLGPSLELLAEMALRPSFPADEVDRLRAQRLNDLLQANADPARRVDRAFAETLYAPGAAYRRLLAGDEASVPRLERGTLAARHEALFDPARAALILAGDLEGLDPVALAAEHFGGWRAGASAVLGADGIVAADEPAPNAGGGRRVVLIDRPGSAQSELRIGHVGLPRRIPDYHAVTVLTAIVGGLFNSRLQRLLREERGYTYGIGAGFSFRRGAGPFAVRTAVETAVTVAAIRDVLEVLAGTRGVPVSAPELDSARDFLVGVFPLRFEGADRVASAVADLMVMDLPDDELDRYRPAVAGVTETDVARAAEHIRPDEVAIVLVGDAGRIGGELERAGFGPIDVVAGPAASTEPTGAEAG